MRATTTYSPHPILPAQDRQTFNIELEGRTLQALLDALPIEETQRLDVHAYVNDKIVPREQWHTFELTQNDVVTLKQRLHGGDNSNPLQIIATLALIYFTAGIGSGFAAGWTAGQVAVTQAVILVTGTLLINALFPPSLPSVEENDENNFSITGGRNRARPYQPLPLVVGTHKVHPDLGAQPYTTQRYPDVYLHQVFNFGFGNLDITDLKIGDTPINNHQDVEWEFSDANGDIDLFPTNVDSISGGLIEYDDGWTTRTTSVDTTQITVELAGVLVKTDTEGKHREELWYYQLQYREVGSPNWIGWETATWLQDERKYNVRTQEMDGQLKYTDVDFAAGESIIVHTGTAPVRRSFNKKVPRGQYEVRLRQSRPLPKLKNWSRVNEIQWTQMRSYQPDTSDYTNQTRLAVEVRASGQFNGALDTVNAIVSARIPVWNGSAWVEAASSNPAYIFLYLARGQADANGKRLWGGNLPDSRLDIEGIKEWAAWCDLHNLECNFVFDRKYTVAQMLELIARTGRATPTWQKGVLGAVFDEEDLPITQVFGMSNIVADSFGVQYLTENLADEIIVKFVNKDIDYQPDEVSVAVPNVLQPASPATVEIAGITNPTQAGREANLIAARQFYHRRRVTFETDIEGLVCGRGDVISLSHDLTSWGASGRLVSATTTDITLDREVVMQPATQYWIGIRYPDNSFIVREVNNPATVEEVTTNTVTLTTPLPAAPNDDIQNLPIDYIYTFDPKSTPGKKLKVVNVSPSSENRVVIAAIDEVPEYYDAEDGTFTYSPPPRYNQTNSEVTNIQVTEDYLGKEQPLRITLTWDLVQAFGARIRMRRNNDTWLTLTETTGSTFLYDLEDWQAGDLLEFEFTPMATVTVRESVTITAITYIVKGEGGVRNDVDVPSPNGLELFGQANNATFTGRDAKFTWRRVASNPVEFGNEQFGAEEATVDDIFLDYEVRILNANGTLRRIEHTAIEEYIYSFEKNSEDGNGIPTRQFTVLVFIRTTTNQISTRPAALTVSNPAPTAPVGVELRNIAETLNINIDTPQDLDFVGTVVHASAVSGFTPSEANRIYKGPGTAASIITAYSVDDVIYFRVAGYDGFDDTSLNYTSEIAYTFAGTTIEEIAAGAINDTAQFAQSIRPIEVVNSLPGTGNFDGRMVFLTTDGKVYRYFSGAWTTAVATADLDGTIDLNSQISGTLTETFADAGLINENITINADGTLSGAGAGDPIELNQLSGQIAAGQIAANAVVAGKIDSLAVTAGTIAAGAVTTSTMTANSIDGDRITTNTLDADKITANSITAGQIQAGAIGTEELAAQSVVASKIAIGDFRGIVPNSNFIDGSDANWDFLGNEAFASVVPRPTSPASGAPTSHVLELLPGDNYVIQVDAPYYEAKEGDQFRITWTGRRSAGTHAVDGTRIIVLWEMPGGTLNETIDYDPSEVEWEENVAIVTAPPTTIGVKLWITRFGLNETATVWLTQIQGRKMDAGELIVDGSITANQINTNFLGAFEITSNTIRNRAPGTGTTPLLTITNSSSPLTIFDIDGTTPLLTTAVGGSQAELVIDGNLSGTFTGSLGTGIATNTAFLSTSGLSDLRDRLGLAQPTGGTEERGGTIDRDPVPVLISSTGTSTVQANNPTNSFKTAQNTVTLSTRLTDTEFVWNQSSSTNYSAPTWTIKFQYSTDNSNWVDVPGSSQSYTGTAQNENEDTIPVTYWGQFNFDVAHEVTWTPTIAAGTDMYWRVSATKGGGSVNAPKVRSLIVSEPLSGANVIGAHTHDASDIVSGVLDTARLGTGTADATTFLRGDGTWSVTSGGSSDVGISNRTTTGTHNLTSANSNSVFNYTGSGALTLNLIDSQFNPGTHLQVHNNGTGAITIAKSTGVTNLYWLRGNGSAPSNTNRSLVRSGVATIVKIANGTWHIFGAGLS